MLGVGASKKTYMDDVFSTYLWKGTGGSQTINNGINLAGEGGLVWTKVRSIGDNHALMDSTRKTGTYYDEISSSGTYAQQTGRNWGISSLNNNGFTLGGSDNQFNSSGATHASWTFRKAKGFFDVVKYTGGSGTQTISHNLGCIPGMIMVKALDSSDNWAVFHRNMDATNPNNYGLKMTNGARFTGTGWNITATTFDAAFSLTNNDGADFVAYLFAGGESTAATARSVDFDGSGDWLSIASTSDFDFGTGDFTIEFWANYEDYSGSPYVCDFRNSGNDGSGSNRIVIYTPGTGSSLEGKLGFWLNGGTRISTKEKIALGTWQHYALVRSSGTTTLYQNGTAQGTYSDSTDYEAAPLEIGHRQGQSQEFHGKISNFRVVKGTAVYTSSFKPPIEPLTNITNTKLLCLNNSSTTGSTVTPGTITATGNPTASTDSPFDDPGAYVFGENGDQNIIKCGSFVGNGSSTGPEINLGWEPQWIMVKNINVVEHWQMVDSMRGIVAGGDDERLLPSNSSSAASNAQSFELTPTGFKVSNSMTELNGNGDTIIYVAIRRPDGYVGKPVETGTDVFAMDYGNGNGTIPTFDSGFPVDFGLKRGLGGYENWITLARLLQGKYLLANTNGGQSSYSHGTFDSNAGFLKSTDDGQIRAWMWKRHAGMDVVTYKGNGTFGHVVNHSMNKSPEMIWIKERSSGVNWYVNHTALTGGGTYASWRGALKLNGSPAAWESANVLGNFSTSSTFTLGGDTDVNGDGDNYIAMLFASTDVSKVGSYTGNGTSGHAITTGFQPRFIIIKCTTQTADWIVLDTARGWGSGDDKYLSLNSDAAQNDLNDFGAPTSTGFTLNLTGNSTNGNGEKYIYYAHA